MSSIVVSGDTSGAITISAPAVSGTNTLTLPAATDTLVGKATTDTLTNKTLTAPTITSPVITGTTTFGGAVASPYTGFKNRIINGAMMIDQRNAGASVTIASGTTYTVDRWACDTSQASKFSVQQSSTAPTGFKNSALITSLSSYSVGTSDYFLFRQAVEGLNFADLAWGTASAATVTLSFWVRSSLTGTFGGVLSNGQGSSRSYPFSYTISAANTWEQKTITVAGDTTGTWLTTTGIGIVVYFGLGVGSTYSGTASAWSGTQYLSATGATSVVGTNGATFYITGVQLEVGSTATSFEYRAYGAELALCQRYYEKSGTIGTAAQATAATMPFATSQVGGTSTITNGSWYMNIFYQVTKRAVPTVTTFPYTTPTNTNRWSNNAGSDYGADSAAPNSSSDRFFVVTNTSGGSITSTTYVFGGWFASAEL